MIRNGMWCVDDENRVGIVAAVSPGGVGAEFHLVDTDGNTTGAVIVPASTLTQARLREIPERRRTPPGCLLTREQFAKLGYQ